MADAIRQRVEEQTLKTPDFDVGPYLEIILRRYGDKVLGVFMYGSTLSSVTRTSTSFPDFFVITDGYRGIFQKMSHWLLAYVVPPHIYHLRLDQQRQCKYNLVSLQRFKRECSSRAKDVYILGRFGKRVALVYSRDAESRKKLLDCCYDAMYNIVPWALRGISKPFDELEFTLACLNLSYAGETRIEASSKVSKLFEAERSLYLGVYPKLLAKHPRSTKLAAPISHGRWYPVGGRLSRWLKLLRLGWFLKRSRIRGIARWPKFLVTVDEWVDILLAKIERAKGIKIELKPRERRHPLIFCWPHFFRLLRAGAITSSKKPPDKNSIKS